MYGLWYCPEHHPYQLNLETVAAFLRGYEKGPAYGPQLDELRHRCDGSSFFHALTWGISRCTEARIWGGQFFLRSTYGLSIPRQGLLSWELDKLRGIGCRDSYDTLPALVMDALSQSDNAPEAKRCFGYVSCAYCATDLRVSGVIRDADTINVQLDTWQCFGGREYDLEDVMIRSMFDDGADNGVRLRPAELPARNLELMFNEGSGPSSFEQRQRMTQNHSCLQWWQWESADDNPPFRYNGPTTWHA